MKHGIYNFILVFLLCEIFTACKEKNELSEANLIPRQKKLTFLIDSTVPGISGNCNYYDGNTKEILLYRNHLKNSLLLFDIKNSKLMNEIVFKKEGPNAVVEPSAIQMVSPDSIFVTSAYVKKVTLINKSGQVIRRFDLAHDPKVSKVWTSEPCYNFQIIKNNLIFETTPLANPFQPLKFYKTALGATYNWRNDKLQTNYLHYPESYMGGEGWGFYHNFYSIAKTNTDNFIVSFPLDNNIYLYSLSGREQAKYNATSRFFSGTVSPYKQPKEFKDYYVEQNAYGNIYYDKYRNVYYRFAYQKAEIRNDDKMPLDPAIFKTASIIILDKNFKIIGETLLPKDKYYFFNSFVGKNGLYISDSNPFNKENIEGKLSFTCYELVKN